MNFLEKYLMRKPFLHTLFCMSILGVYFYFYRLRFFIIGIPQKAGITFQLAGVGFLVVCVYLGRWLYEKWLLQQKVSFFSVYFLLFSIGMVFGWCLALKVFFYPNARILELSINYGPILLLSFIVGILLKILRATSEKQILEAQLESKQRQSELNLLQSQLSPHFLFNTLNNLYGLSIKQDERIPKLLLKLSDLLRYSLYQTRESVVALTNEIVYLNNYIAFERLRLGKRLHLECQIDADNTELLVAPMILIVFIENAFKHAKESTNQAIEIKIQLFVNLNGIHLDLENSFQKQAISSNSVASGLGLMNVTKRLDLIYGETYQLTQQEEGSFYKVYLNLPLQTK
jgi:sensor histidine kinase YesM